MPTVKNKITGKVISRQPYNQEGINNASTIAESKPEWEVENAMERTQTMYPGGGQTGYNVPQYKRGGVVLLKDIAKDAAMLSAMRAGKKSKKSKKGITGPYSEKLGPGGYKAEVKKREDRKATKAKMGKLAKDIAKNAAILSSLRKKSSKK